MKLKQNNVPRLCAVTVICFLILLFCVSCGSSSENLEIHIKDGNCETIVSVPAGETVADILEKAEITLKADDIVTPGLTEKINGNDVIQIDRYANVTLADQGEIQTLSLNGKTVGEALDAAGITLGAHDTLNHSTQAYLSTGMEIIVDRWCEVTILLDGEEMTTLTQSATVSELLNELQIDTDEKDRVEPVQETQITDGLVITINRVSKQRVTEEEEIEYETIYQDSSSLYEGNTSVQQEGQNGIKTYTYEITIVDGVEESRELVGEEVTVEPVDEIILQGTKKKETATKSSGSSSSGSSSSSSSGSSIVSKQAVYDCDGSGHGYYVITYSDGRVDYQDF